MASPADWIEGIRPDDAAVDVARRVVGQRLRAVWYHLPNAAKHPEQDIEHVHQLRVATRRASAAARVFRDVARKKYSYRVTKELKRIRRAAGAARDLDVLCLRLQLQDENATLARAVAFATARRNQVQQPLVDVYRRCKRKGWKRRAKKLADRKAWRNHTADRPFCELASEVLRQETDQFFRFAATQPTDLAGLHQLRIRAKKLRYTVEIAAGVLDDSLRSDIYPEILSVHEHLGAINDQATATAMFRRWHEQAQRPEDIEVFADLRSAAEQQAETARIAFLHWWSSQRRASLGGRLRAVLG